jgi:lambda family phage portal protein
MSAYAQLPSGILAPTQIAHSVMHDMLFGNHGAYRSAQAGNKNLAGWATSHGSADADTLADLPTLRRQSSDLIRNDALPAGIIASNVTAVVGTGVVPQSRIDHEFLGISEEQAAAWQRRAERIFAQVADKAHWDAENKLTFYQQQAIVQRSRKERGDAFALRRFIKRSRKLLGVSVQLVEADRVDTPSDKATDTSIRSGIRMDGDGAPLGYFVAQKHPGEKVNLTAREDFTEIPAFDQNGDPLVLAVIERLRPGQTRGVPYLAPVIEIFKQLCRYTEAEITAAVISGMLAMVVTSPAPVGPLGPGIPSTGIPGMVGKQIGVKGSQIQRLQSGMILDLAPGEDIKVVDSTRPNTAFDPFVMSVLRQIGAALEIPFEVLIKHFQSSYSAARAALIDAWRFWLKERQFLVDTFCQPCWEWAISEAVATGLLDAPGFFDDLLIRQAWLGTEWIGQAMPSIDPVKDAEAATRWNALNVLPLQTISAQQGRDFERDFNQIVREKRLLDGAGLQRPGDVPPAADAPPDPGVANPPPQP